MNVLSYLILWIKTETKYIDKKNTCENKSLYVTVKNVFQRIFLAYFVIISCKLITIDYTVSRKKKVVKLHKSTKRMCSGDVNGEIYSILFIVYVTK